MPTSELEVHSPKTTDDALVEYFRCPGNQASFEIDGGLSANSGFFKVGAEMVCYGRCSGGSPSDELIDDLFDAAQGVGVNGDRVRLPFDLPEVIDNLRLESYHKRSAGTSPLMGGDKTWRKIYYLLRPLLPVLVRKRFQKSYLSGWDKIAFPRWPVDFSVDTLMRSTMELALRSRRGEKIPFIWFWPDGAPACAIMTHDVETSAGLNFCDSLMDCDDLLGIKSSFQIIPEVRYRADDKLLDEFRRRGFEINVHDFNHDGSLFQDREIFLQRAAKINEYAGKFRSDGFRAGAMYRNQSWFDALQFSYDMSVPNVAHLDPQRGGCCTVMPYFVGKMLEIPLTTTQDYSLFNILGDYSADLWMRQMDLIVAKNGLMSFITHPDYLLEQRARELYLDLLTRLAKLRVDKNVWIPLPGDVNRWWRARQQMSLVKHGDRLFIEGPECQRARVAYATLVNDRLAYELEEAS